MKYRRLGIAVMTSIAVGMTTAAPADAVRTAAASRTETGTRAGTDPTITIQKRRSSKCKSPKRQTINVSYKTGFVSTTFYFNNHCKQRRAFKVKGAVGQKPPKFGTLACIAVNAGTKGDKKVRHPGYGVTTIEFISKC